MRGRDIRELGRVIDQVTTPYQDAQKKVLSRILTIPPASPPDDVRYIIPFNATGVWAGRKDKIAWRQRNDWTYLTVDEGSTAWVKDEARELIYNGTDWVANTADDDDQQHKGDLLYGTGAPVNTFGFEGDFYLDVEGGRVLYGPKQNGVWPLPGYNLQGAAGEDGAIGEAGGMTQTQHARLRQLQHYADGPYDASCIFAVDPGLFPARSEWRRLVDDKLIYESLVTWNGVLVAVEIQKLYDTDGTTVLITVTDTYTYDGLQIAGIQRVIA